MKPRRGRKKLEAKSVSPSVSAGADRLDQTILHLPCYEPSGMALDVTLRDLLRHLLIVGQTGAGKTTVLNQIWADLIAHRCPQTGRRLGLLILDSQGDHTASHIRHLAAQAGRAADVRVLSTHEGYLHPLAELVSFEALDSATAKLVSATKFASHEQLDGSEAYWTENTRALIEAGLTCLLIGKSKIGMIEALRFLFDLFLEKDRPSNTRKILERVDQIVAATVDLSSGVRAKIDLAQNIIRNWEKMDLRTRTIIQSCLRIALSPFLATSALPYWDDRKGGMVDPAEALSGKIIVVCTRAATEVETAKMICQLVKMDFYRAAQNRRGLGQNGVAGLVMDEFHYAVTTGSARWSDVTNLATLRSKGVFVIAASQGLIQLDLLLGRVSTEALLINFGNLILMRSVEIGHLYAMAERVFGHNPTPTRPLNQIIDGGNILIPIMPFFVPPAPVCPPGALAQLETHQAFVSLASGFKTLQPIWLAPLYLEEPAAEEASFPDADLALLRRAKRDLSGPVKKGPEERDHYSFLLWYFLINAAPRFVKSNQGMTLQEFRRSLKGLGHQPTGLETIPPVWRMACFQLARRLKPDTRLLLLKMEQGKLEIMFLASSSAAEDAQALLRRQARWRRSVYPTPIRPLRTVDLRWLAVNFPHLLGEFASKNKNSP